MMISRILVALDGSKAGESVLSYVTPLATALGAPVTLLTVSRVPEDTVEGLPERQAHDYLQTVENRLAQARVQVSSAVTVGDPSTEIVRHAEQEQDVLIALSTHGRSGFSRWWYGSVAERVLHMSRVPILLVRAGPDGANAKAITRIVVPLDGRPLSESVIPLAVSLARTLHVPIALMRTVSPPSLLADPSFGLGSSATERETLASLRLSAESYLTALADGLTQRGLSVTTQAVEGNPVIEIIGTAEAQAGSLIVMATHSRTGMAGTLLGSVARRIVHESSVPVLLVRPRAFSQAR
jgi:nucleotide-binding universal stress UspA family protein